MKQYIRPWLFLRKTIMCFLLKFQPFCPLQRNEVIAASGAGVDIQNGGLTDSELFAINLCT